MPVRLIVMVLLSASIISAVGFKLLFQQSTGTRILAGVLITILVVEYLPKPIPTSQITPPEAITLLKNLPGNQGLLDVASKAHLALYYQTIHERPMAFGPVSRVPASTDAKDKALIAIVDAGQYRDLCRRYGIRYLLAKPDRDVPEVDPSIRLLYDKEGLRVYDLGAGAPCQVAPEVVTP